MLTNNKRITMIIERFSNPTKYDLAPSGTIYKHEDKFFIQVAQNPQISNWITLGDFFLAINQDLINDSDFISKCMGTYLSRVENSKVK